MKNTILIIGLIVSVNIQMFGQSALVQTVVNSVSGDSIFTNIALFEQMERYTIENNLECADYIVSSLDNNGFDTIYLHNYTQGWLPNIIAVKYGTLFPDSIYVLGAHYDSYVSGAPGADDNASGTAGVLEAARILSNYSFEKTIMIVLFSGEEYGYLGSEAFTDSLINNNINISAMINLDMISYVKDGDDLSVSICVNDFSIDLMNSYINSINSYIPYLIYEIDSTSFIVWGSDHASFWSKEIPAIFLTEESDYFSANFNPFIHSENDILGLSANNMLFSEQITKSVVATLINLAEIDTTILFLDDNNKETILVYPN